MSLDPDNARWSSHFYMMGEARDGFRDSMPYVADVTRIGDHEAIGSAWTAICVAAALSSAK